MSQPARGRKRGDPPHNLSVIFQDYLNRHVHKLTIRRPRATGLAPCHDDRHPSFSANLEKCVWYCFACNRGGGVKDFALLVGEPWGVTRSESRVAKARRARFQAEQQARAIFERRVAERDLLLCTEYREVYGEMLGARDLLGLFYRRPDLAEEFAPLAARTEQAYGDLLFRLSVLEARLDGEVAA